MLDLGTQLRDYFEQTTPPVQMHEIVPLLERVAPEPRIVVSPRRRLTGWAFAALAVVVVGIAVGGAAWLLNATEPAIEPAATLPGIPTTIVTTPISTVPDATTVARGSGPEIRWTKVEEAPLSIQTVGWFDDAFYGLGRTSRGPVLYRSSDGTAWEVVEGFTDIAPSNAAGGPNRLVAGADRIMVCLVDPSPHMLTVVTSLDGDTWHATQIEVVAPSPLEDSGTFSPGLLAAGPAGFLVSASVEGVPDYEGLIASVYGWEVANDLSILQFAGDRLLFTTQSGTEYELSLSDLDLTYADLVVEGTGARAWWSPDGVSWQASVREGPLLSPGFGSMVAVDDGFLVTRIGVGLWKTTDGSAWEAIDPTYSDASIYAWNGAVLEYRWMGGNLRMLGSSEALPVSEAFDVDDVYPVEVGEAGIIAALGQFSSVDESEDAPKASIVFSPDGTQWRSTPFDGGSRLWIEDFAVGSDRVLMLSFGGTGSSQLWVGVPEQ